MASYFYAAFVVLLLAAVGVASDGPILSTTLGTVQGLEKTLNDTEVEIYYGIPFAQPPLKWKRFYRSLEAKPWQSNPRDGTIKPPACWQGDDPTFSEFPGTEMWRPSTDNVSEDCLYLNVWRSKVRSSPKRIMVWIHGGGFWSGSAVLDEYDGSELVAREDVILVTVAYRLGALGFIYLKDKLMGNYGLYDQYQALKWVRDNAANLGGSPDDITIFGEDAGAASVGFHLLSPASRRLVSNGIMESGSPLSRWALMEEDVAHDRCTRVLEKLGCDVSGKDEDLSKCMVKLSAQELNAGFMNTLVKWYFRYKVPLAPVVGSFLLKEHPRDRLRNGDFTPANVIIGVNKNEGVLTAFRSFREDFPKLNNRRRFRDLMGEVTYNNKQLKRMVIKHYDKNFETSSRRIEIVDTAIGDAMVKCPVLEFASEYTSHGAKVYVYSFEERSSSNPWPEWMGVPRGSEVQMVFGAPFKENSNDVHDNDEQDLSEMIMRLWTSFAKTGTPVSADTHWPAYTVEYGEYLQLGGNGTSASRDFRSKACPMWIERLDTHWENKNKSKKKHKK